jgi:ATP-binding cassette subfamily C (CFTR/MRP) protein 1
MSEYGSLEQESNELDGTKNRNHMSLLDDKQDEKKANATLMQEEERNTGAVTWNVYSKYLRFAGGQLWAFIIIGLLIVNQGALGKTAMHFGVKMAR